MMKNYLLILSLLALAACSKSKGDNPSGDTPSISITVWDATKWSSSKPKGELSAGVTVSLYKSQEAFAANTQPDYTGQTGTDGVVQLNGVNPGTYYVVAKKGALGNIFNVYFEMYNSVLLGYAPDEALDNAGKFIWKDLNMDGKVDTHDQTGQPALSVQVVKDKRVDITVMIGYMNKPLTTVAEVQAELDGVYAGLSNFYQNLVIMDGTLSDDAACGSVTSYCPLDDFTFVSGTSVFNSIWSDAYFKGIHKATDVMWNAAGLTAASADQKDLLAQVIALRSYIYIELLTYFGDVPVSNKDVTPEFWPGVSRRTVSEVYASAMSDLSSAIPDLPATRTDGKAAITRYAAMALAARGALQQKKYNDVLTYTSQIIGSHAFSLASAGYSWLTSQNTSETIWAPAFSNIGTTASWYFSGAFGGTTLQWCPVLRYADVLLMDAEAQIATGHFDLAADDINPLRARYSEAPVSFTTETDGNTWLQAAWLTEKYRQGGRYANLLRWGTAQSVLGPGGWHPNNSRMPVPQNFLNIYPGLMQNPGY